MRRRFLANDWKCHKTMESLEKVILRDSRLPLQISVLPTARTRVRRTRRWSENHRE